MPNSATVLAVQHQDSCPPALFAGWLAAAGLTLDVRRPYRDEALPAGLDGHAGLLVLGGSMGAHDDAAYPWLTATKDLLREATHAGAPVLGICLGHQLAAVAQGGASCPNPRGQTAGVRAVGWAAAAADDPLCRDLSEYPDGAVPHWNSDVVTDVPDRAVVLAATDDGAPQVLRFGERSWGVQFHPEADHAVVSAWADEDRERAADRCLDVDEALQQVKEQEALLHATGRRVAEAFAGIVLGQQPGRRPGRRPGGRPGRRPGQQSGWRPGRR